MKEHYKYHSELDGLQERLQKLYGLIEWRCNQKHPPGRARIHERTWCATLAEIAEQLGLKGKTRAKWVSLLLSRLRALKLIDWKRRGPYASEYWNLAFPNPIWLAHQATQLGNIHKSKIKDLAHKEVGLNQKRGWSEPTSFGLKSFPCNTNFSLETNTKTPSSPTPSPRAASRSEHKHARENENHKPNPVPVARDHLGRCAHCGARLIDDLYCVCPGGIAAFSERLREYFHAAQKDKNEMAQAGGET